jgi:hypothetical protein
MDIHIQVSSEMLADLQTAAAEGGFESIETYLLALHKTEQIRKDIKEGFKEALLGQNLIALPPDVDLETFLSELNDD